MANSFVFIQPDPFKGVGKRVTSYIPDYANQGSELEVDKYVDATNNGFNQDAYTYASRPINGISIKPNTHAFIQVINADGKVLQVFNQLTREPARASTSDAAGSFKSPSANKPGQANPEGTAETAGNAPMADAWTDWILQGVREERVEKTQIVETFGETYLYAFGERPRSLVFNGLLMNTLDYNWRAIFWENWDNYFRATRLIERNARIWIGFDDIIVEGYPLNAVASQTADSPNAMSFSFSFYVTNYTNLAAQRNFRYQGADNLAVVRSGFQTGIAELKSSRISITELFGFQGAAKAGNLIYKEAIEAGFSENVATIAGRTVGSAANIASKSVFTAISSPANTVAFLRAARAKTALEVFRTGANAGARALEDKYNLKRGEVNAWFGLLGRVLDGLDNNEALAALNLSGGAFETLKLGSIDRIVQVLAYNASKSFLGPRGQETEETRVLALNFPTPKPGGIAVVNKPPRPNPDTAPPRPNPSTTPRPNS